MLRSSTAMKMLAATMPTNAAAIHSIVSMKRSIEARFMSAPRCLGCKGGSRETAAGASRRRVDGEALLLRQRVVLGQLGAKLGHRRIRIAAGFLDVVRP